MYYLNKDEKASLMQLIVALNSTLTVVTPPGIYEHPKYDTEHNYVFTQTLTCTIAPRREIK